jgi:hypothetical protein
MVRFKSCFSIPKQNKTQLSFSSNNYPTTSSSDLKSQDSTSLARHRAGDRPRAEKRVLVSDRIRGHVALGRIVQATTEVGVDNRGISRAMLAIDSIPDTLQNKPPTYPTSFESRLVTGTVTLLKTLLWTSAWAPMRVLMAVLMLSGQSVSLTVD